MFFLFWFPVKRWNKNKNHGKNGLPYQYTVVAKVVLCTGLQIIVGIEDNSKIFFLFLNENICFDPSLEPSRQDGSNDGSKICFMEKCRYLSLNYPSKPFLSGALIIYMY